MSMVDLATYNKALGEKLRLTETLRRLQGASGHALKEFNLLKQQHLDILNESQSLKEALSVAKKEKSQLESKLSQSEFLLKRMAKVSKASIAEFKELKQRYCDEYERRKDVEEKVVKLTKMIADGNISTGTAQDKVKKAPAVDKNRTTQLENELARMKVQLRDTTSELVQLRETSQEQYKQMETRIQKELMKAVENSHKKLARTISKTKLSAVVEPDTTHIEPPPSLAQRIPIKLADEIRTGVKLKKTPVSSPTSDTKSIVQEQAKRISQYTSGGFGKLMQLLKQDEMERAAKEQKTNRDYRVVQPDSAAHSTENEATEVAEKLLQSSRESQQLLEKSISSLIEQSRYTDSTSSQSRHSGTTISTASKGRDTSYQSSVPPAAISNTSSARPQHRPESAQTLIGVVTGVKPIPSIHNPDMDIRDAETAVATPVDETVITRNLSRSSLQEIQNVFDELEDRFGIQL